MCNNSNNSSNLPLVACISTPERKRNYLWFDGGSLLKSPKIQIWSLDDDVKEMREKGIIIPTYTELNDLLILHPYEINRYIHIEDLEKSETKAAKFFKYKEILQELGAVSYKVVSGTKEEYERDTSVNVWASFKSKGSGKVDVNDNENFTNTMGFGLEATFDGVRTISDQSYQNAKKLIEKYRLEDDIFINTLVNARDPQKENHQRTEHLQYKAMQEFNRCVDVAVVFNVVKIFDFSTNAILR